MLLWTYRLINWDVDNMSRDARCNDQIPKALTLEHCSSILRAVEYSIDCHESA